MSNKLCSLEIISVGRLLAQEASVWQRQARNRRTGPIPRQRRSLPLGRFGVGRKEEAGGSTKVKAAAERPKPSRKGKWPSLRGGCMPSGLLGFLSGTPCLAISASAVLLQSYVWELQETFKIWLEDVACGL